jgi:hypothetical protein
MSLKFYIVFCNLFIFPFIHFSILFITLCSSTKAKNLVCIIFNFLLFNLPSPLRHLTLYRSYPIFIPRHNGHLQKLTCTTLRAKLCSIDGVCWVARTIFIGSVPESAVSKFWKIVLSTATWNCLLLWKLLDYSFYCLVQNYAVIRIWGTC